MSTDQTSADNQFGIADGIVLAIMLGLVLVIVLLAIAAWAGLLTGFVLLTGYILIWIVNTLFPAIAIPVTFNAMAAAGVLYIICAPQNRVTEKE